MVLMSIWIKRLKEKWWYVLVSIYLLVVPLFYVSITPFYIYIQHFLFNAFLFSSVFLGMWLIRIRFSLKWKKAPIEELRREDSVLLEGIGVFQGTLFIYLSLSEELVSSSRSLNILRLSIPLVTVLFYILRGYGAVKNSSRHRHYSSLLLIYYLYFEVVFLLDEVVTNNLPIYVDSTNIVPLYFSTVNLVPFTFISQIHKALSIRYGSGRKSYSRTKGTHKNQKG